LTGILDVSLCLPISGFSGLRIKILEIQNPEDFCRTATPPQKQGMLSRTVYAMLLK
jgi:hypothetical protein